jgi:hypothetical protein
MVDNETQAKTAPNQLRVVQGLWHLRGTLPEKSSGIR